MFRQGAKIWRRFLFVLFVLLSSSISCQEKTKLTQTKNTIYRRDGSWPLNLDPMNLQGTWEIGIARDLFLGLLTDAADGSPILGAAASWQTNNENTVYTFYLRKDNYWSDGKPVTAHDFVFAYKRILHPAAKSLHARELYIIKNARAFHQGLLPNKKQPGILALDNYTLQITLESPFPSFLDQLRRFIYYPVPRHVVQQFKDEWSKPENLVSNGPFKLEQWQEGEFIKLKKNYFFYDSKNVFTDIVIYFPIEDNLQAFEKFLAGKLDISTDFPVEKYQWLREKRPQEVRVFPYAGIYTYVINQRLPKFQDKHVREALSLAIDRKKITHEILLVNEQPAYSLVPPKDGHQMPHLYFRDIPYKERLQRARVLLQKAGYTDRHPLKLRISFNSRESHKKVAHAVADMWANIGVKSEFSENTTATHFQKLAAGDFEIGRVSWIINFSEPRTFLERLQYKSKFNFGKYKSQKFENFMDMAAQNSNAEQHARLLNNAKQTVLDDFAIIPVYFFSSKNLVNKNIKGWIDNIHNIHPTRWLYK